MTDEREENSQKDEVKTLFIDIVHFHSNRTKLFFHRHLKGVCVILYFYTITPCISCMKNLETDMFFIAYRSKQK